MRKILVAFFLLAGLTACKEAKTTKKTIDEEALAAKGLVISETNFPDANLRKFLLAQGFGADWVITPEEMAAISTINIDNMNIQSAKGMENFTGLASLSLNGNPLSELPLASFAQLQQLKCSECGLKRLDIRTCQQLAEVDCSGNLLDSINVSGMPVLTALNASGNKLQLVTLNDCPQLKNLNLSSNKLAACDLSRCSALRNINIADNTLSIEVASYDAFVKSLPLAAAPTEEEKADNIHATITGLYADRLSPNLQNIVQQKGWTLIHEEQVQ